METGEVAHWREADGYGFIRPHAGIGDVFLHRRALPHGATVEVGDRLEFECERRDRGLYATQARIVG